MSNSTHRSRSPRFRFPDVGTAARAATAHAGRPARPPHLALVLLLAMVISGCRDDVLAPESPAPGEAARVVLTSVTAAGGREIRQETRIDSAAGRYAIRECSSAPIGASCTALVVVREGAVSPSVLQELFLAPSRPAFRALRAEYRGSAEIRPPDGGGVRLEIVRSGTRRVITWESHAYLPLALVEFQCILIAARADPFPCD